MEQMIKFENALRIAGMKLLIEGLGSATAFYDERHRQAE